MLPSMPSGPSRVNRGPAAAPGNRAAILAAARTVFADRGYHVPLRTIAAAAGVGQGVLYRHFPTRLDLALAVFEDNFTELEAIAAEPQPERLVRLWSRIIELTITQSAFVEMVLNARGTLTGYDGEQRLRTLIDTTLSAAKTAGLVDPHLTTEDLMLRWRMAFGLVTTAAQTQPGDLERLIHTTLPLAAAPPGL